MNENKFTGIFPALFTAFNEDGAINENAIESLINMNLKRGVKGFYVGGSSAETFLMTVEERMLVLRLCSEIVGGRATMIAQVGDASEDKALRLASFARLCGYDAVSAVTPFYYKFTFSNIKNYYRDIAGESGLPLFIYHIPALTGINFTLDQVMELMEPDYVAGIKYTCNDLYTFERVRSAYPQKTTMFGVDEMLLSGLALGADGAIGTTYNYMPEKAVGIANALADGNLAEARRLQSEINTVLCCLHKIGLFEGSKALLRMMGLDVGYCRRPFGRLSEDAQNMLREVALPFMEPVR